MVRLIASLLFFFSGLTSLVYQVVWQRELFTALGSDVFATSMVLSAFMLGLAAGAFIIGKIVGVLRSRLRLYGILEILIGCYAFAFNDLLNFAVPRMHALYASSFLAEPLVYWTVKFIVLSCLLLPPTVLMGATLPLVVRAFVASDNENGRLVARFYAINTAGACMGVLAAGFVLLPLLGMVKITYLTIAVNVLIGLFAIILSLVHKEPSAQDLAAVRGPRDLAQVLPRNAVLYSAFAIGFCILALEVIWSRMLVLYFSATVYAFSIMVMLALSGIFVGSYVMRKVIDVHRPGLAGTYTTLLMALGTYVAVTGILVYVTPTLYNFAVFRLVGAFHSKDAWFWATTICQIQIAGFFIVPPCVMSGCLFPLAVALCTSEAAKIGRCTASIYTANTIGSVVGPLVAGFCLIPVLGIKSSLAVVAVVLVLSGVGLALLLPSKSYRVLAGAVLANAAIIAVAVTMPVRVLANYASVDPRTKVLFYREGVFQTISLLKNVKGQTSFLIDGNVEADDSFTQRRHFILKAHLPVLLSRKPDDVLVIGLGMGITTNAFCDNPLVKSVDVVELSPEVIRAQSHLKAVNDDVLGCKKVRVINDDGRNYLAASDKTYGVISIDPIHPRIAGVGTLYTEQFYELVKNRLHEGGVFLQWMPSYQMSPGSFKIAVNSFFRVFDRSILLYVRGHFLFVGFKGDLAIDFTSLKERFELVREDMASIKVNSAVDLMALTLMAPENIGAFLGNTPLVNTDDNLLLEYRAPRDFLYGVDDILHGCEPYAGFPAKYIVRSTPEELAAMETAWNKRKQSLLLELQDSAD